MMNRAASLLASKLTQRSAAANATTASKRTFASSENLVKTSLNELHKELGGDMVPFAGYELPVLYKGENGGVMKEHLWCRSEGKSSLFDVSHMGQVRFCLLDELNELSKRQTAHHHQTTARRLSISIFGVVAATNFGLPLSSI